MAFEGKIRNLGTLAAAITNRLRDAAYRPPTRQIAGVDSSNWPSAEQPVAPIGPPGSQPLSMPFWQGQNLNFTPRTDEEYTAADLRTLSKYPLARICIENSKDMLCRLPCRIQLRQQPGESPSDISQRRRKMSKGDPMLVELSRFWEQPDGENSWPDWLRPLIDDMLVIDAPTILAEKTFDGKLAAFRRLPGDNICRYVDDRGLTPKPPSPAYAQLWEGIPRIQFDSATLLYKPRNIVTRNTVASYLYGYSPVEQVASEIQIGMARLEFVWNYYRSGSIPNAIQVVPPNVDINKMKEAMDWINSELSGNLNKRRNFRLIQGFNRDGKDDQIIFPKEPTLADFFDELHIRKLCFAFGTSPQRLQRMMNRASSQSNQEASEEESIRPWKDWIERSIINPLIWRMCGGRRDYEMVLIMQRESEAAKRSKIDVADIREGKRTINEVRVDNGDDPFDDPAADELAVTTATGRVPIGFVPEPKLIERGDKTPVDKPKPVAKFEGEVPCLTQ